MARTKVKKALKPPPLTESWFWVCALYRSERRKKAGEPERKTHLWERRVFVFKAHRGGERKAARALAKSHEHKFKNVYGEVVYWRFQAIESYAELFDKRITSGTEVYWTFFRKRAAEM